jgi:hypothetical protein
MLPMTSESSLEAAGVKIWLQRMAAAQRKEYLRRSNDISKELANLAPKSIKKLAAGLKFSRVIWASSRAPQA